MSTKSITSILPIISLLISATLWGVSWYPLRLLENQGIQGLWTTVVVYSIPALVGAILLFRRRFELRCQPGWLLLIAVANAWCNVAFILAVLDGNVMRVLLLFYLSPIWATLLGVLVLGEHLSRRAVLTLAVAMCGAVFMLWDPQMGHPWPKYTSDWLAISSGLAFAFANVAVRKTQEISVPVKNLCSWVGVSVLACIWLLVADIPVPQVAAAVWWWTALLGPGIVVVMTFTVQYGVTKLPVYRSAVILLFELVAGAVSSQLLTEEIMTTAEWLGGGLIVIAAYLSARFYLEVEGSNKTTAATHDS